MARTASLPVASTATTRELTLEDGSSRKFWTIELEGRSYKVRFGRLGTNGQTQTKKFTSEAKARQAFDKLVAEKLKKGYVDAAGGQASTAAAPAKPTASEKKTAKAAGSAEAPVAAPTPAAPGVDLSLTRRIDLTPVDWMRATFRPRQPLPRPEPESFDPDKCVARLVKAIDGEGDRVCWEEIPLSPAMSRQEAHFWLVAMSKCESANSGPKAVAAKLAKATYDGRLSVAQVAKFFDPNLGELPDVVMTPLNVLLRPDEMLELGKSVLASLPRVYSEKIAGLLTQGFSTYVLPYLTDDEVASYRQVVRKGFDPGKTPQDVSNPLPAEYYLAAALGMHDEVYAITSTWADDRFSRLYGGKGLYRAGEDETERPQAMLFGLGSAELVESEWRRLKLKMRSPENARGFLACTQYAALDCLRDSILEITEKEDCRDMLEVLALVHAPEAAEPMLACKLGSKVPVVARAWLERNLGCAVAGLIGTADGRGKLADAAREFLEDAKRRGYGSLIESAAKGVSKAEPAARFAHDLASRDEKICEPLDASATPGWLRQAIDECDIKSRRLPTWASPTVLPPLVLGERRLNDEQMGVVLNVLAATPVGKGHPLLAALKEHVAAPCRDEFAWKLFQSWIDDGAPAKERWAMGTIGHLGGDLCALRLTPLVRVWPGEMQFSRSVFGLECLRGMGSDAALMQLAGVAQKVKSSALKAKAQQFVNEIAAERGMTRAELEDRVVPDCGLDENGRRELSFGPRSFSFVLAGDLKPMVRDADGKLRGDLPKPGAKDDAATAQQSLAEWKLLKKQVREVAQLQAGRLEQAMVTGRRWKAADFETLLVRHPLLVHLVRPLIWAAFDERGRKLTTFRVTEERDYADVADSPVSLSGAAAVGLVHPLELSPKERGAWGEVLGDYEIVPPFPQLARPVYALEAGEQKDGELKRFHGLRLVAPTLVFTLEKLGWTRGRAGDGGSFEEHSKQFSAAEVTAVIGYDGIASMGYISPDEMLTIRSVRFVSGMRPPSGHDWDKKNKLTLGQVPPVVVSEVLADIQVLKSKGK